MIYLCGPKEHYFSTNEVCFLEKSDGDFLHYGGPPKMWAQAAHRPNHRNQAFGFTASHNNPKRGKEVPLGLRHFKIETQL